MKKKVLFVITKSNWGGAQRYVFDLVTHLPLSFECTVALGGTGTKRAPMGLLATALQQRGIRTLPITSFMRDISLVEEWRAFFELVRLYKMEQPDIVHLNSSKAGGLGALAARIAGIPHIIFTAHGLPYEENRPLLIKGMLYVATWVTCLLATKIVAISRKNQDSLTQLWGCAHKVVLIHNGIPPLSFLSQIDARATLSSYASALPSGIPWIGCIAEYTPNKGLSYLIQAVHTLHTQGTPALLFLIGEGEERPHLERLITHLHAHSYIFLCGFMSDAYKYLPAFDVLAFPSLKEGLPYTLLEAGQAGIAIVASKVGGIPDIVVDHETGLLISPKDEKELTDNLHTLIQNQELRMRYGTTLQQKIATEFSLSTMVERTAALYSTTS